MTDSLRKLSDDEARELESFLSDSGKPFQSIEKAEDFFFAQCEKDLEEINLLNTRYPELDLDLKATSLLRLERFYFDCYVNNKISTDISKERFEELMTQYMRHVFVYNEMAEWAVFENDFAEGRYDFGLLYGYGSGTTEHYADELDNTPDNPGHDYLYKHFMLYVPEERAGEV
ncbi:MAG: hypothetical protein WDO71_25430 [Bacteroidota bacterium]